jgi:hypothetical protein
MEIQDLAWHLLAQGPGRKNLHANAASIPNLTGKARRINASGYCVTSSGGGGPTLLSVKGRVAWALDCLNCGGAESCTPIDVPGPRWSAYVHTLRKLGVPIETVHEWHRGEYPGRHARYVLRADVRRVGV